MTCLGVIPQEDVEIWSALRAILGIFYVYLGLHCVASQTYSLLTKTLYFPLGGGGGGGGGSGPPDPPPPLDPPLLSESP